jgi:hypothetical protein
MIIVRANMRPTGTPKHLKKVIVGGFLKKTLKRCLHISSATRKLIYKETSFGKGIIPIA